MDSDTIPLSALQHWLFCPRQCCLIHVERLWEENRFTAEGRILHERAHTPGHETRRDVKILRSLPLHSQALGVSGTADVVELREGVPYPVEYKRGRPKAHRADEVQLCAQAICLEEMFATEVAEGALFYGEARRRTNVLFDTELRNLTAQVARQASEAITLGKVPLPVYEKKRCNTCSLFEQCRPRQIEPNLSIANWLVRRVSESGDS